MRLPTCTTRRLTTVSGLLAMALVAGAAPAAAAPAPPGCVGVQAARDGGGTVGRLWAALGVVVTVDAQGGARRAPAAVCPPAPRRSNGEATSAAVLHHWGEPTRADEFDGTALGPAWNVYDGPGHGGKGRRTPDAVGVRDGILTITGDPKGNTAGMEWGGGQRYGRWEGRVRAPASDPTYNALLLLWPDAENFPVGGEIDFMEMMDHTRQKTNVFLHYGKSNKQVSGSVVADATAVAQLGRRVDADPRRDLPRRQGVVAHRARRRSSRRGRCTCASSSTGSRSRAGGRVQTSTMQVDWVKQYAVSPRSRRSRAGRTRR